MMRRYVIVGSGAAGIASIEAIRSQDSQGEIILVAEDSHGYYSRPGLAYYLSKEIPETGLYPFTKQDFSRLNVKWVNCGASGINPATHRLVLTDGRTIPYDRLLIATGSKAARMPVPGIELEGSVKLDDLNDVHRIIKLAHRGKTAVVVGGGITALELVEGLAARGVKVHYFLREDRYWSNVLDESESRIVEECLREDGVKIHYYTEMVEILGKRNRVIGVRTKKDEIIPCDIVAIAIGVRPRIELAASCEIKTDRGILVNEFMQTNIPDIFAAGDVGQALDPRTGKFVLDTLWDPARTQGHYAGTNMAGHSIAYSKQISHNVTRLAGLTTTIIGSVGSGGRDSDLVGIARGDSESWRDSLGTSDKKLIAAQSDFDINRLRLLVGDTNLVGAFIMGDQTLSYPMQQLIVHQANITPIREQLLQSERSLSETITSFYQEWQNHYAG
jgi:nitrite reductase (NADH) large subunit